jgi:hypothetical protein
MRWRLLSTLISLLALLVMSGALASAQGKSHGRGNQPPGWSHGQKTGWGNCDLPPGLAKKRGCIATGFQMVRYPVDRGRIVVVRVPVDHRGWFSVDDGHRLWVDERGFWQDDRSRVRLSIVVP